MLLRRGLRRAQLVAVVAEVDLHLGQDGPAGALQPQAREPTAGAPFGGLLAHADREALALALRIAPLQERARVALPEAFEGRVDPRAVLVVAALEALVGIARARELLLLARVDAQHLELLDGGGAERAGLPPLDGHPDA